jgi:phage shock protein A
MTSPGKLFPSIQKTLQAIQQTKLDQLLHQSVTTMSDETIDAIKKAARELSLQCRLLRKNKSKLAAHPAAPKATQPQPSYSGKSANKTQTMHLGADRSSPAIKTS